MTLQTGLTLFEECLRHPEPLIDDAYCQDALIISEHPSLAPTPIMQANSRLLERITAFKLAQEDGNEADGANHLQHISRLLETADMNFVEFTSFWPSLDVSYSTYRKLSPSEKTTFLRQALSYYIGKRHGIYGAHGYSPTSIQVRRDFETHKRRGNAAVDKLRLLLSQARYVAVSSVSRLLDEPRSYGFFGAPGFQRPDLARLIRELGVDFRWHREHQNKLPDFVLHGPDGRVLIGEAKHMKETGGGQDKQVSELIALVSQDDVGTRGGYVGYLDGIYFNALASPGRVGGKAHEQVGQIRAALERQPRNAFVNTHGFRVLIGLAGLGDERPSAPEAVAPAVDG